VSGADKRRTARRAFVPDKEWTREEVDAFIEHNPIGFSVYCGRHEPRDFIATFRRTTNRFDGTPTWAPHPFWIDGDRYGRTRDNCGLQAIDGVGHVVPFSWTAVFDPDPHNPLSELVYSPDGSATTATGKIRFCYQWYCDKGDDDAPCRENLPCDDVDLAHRVFSQFVEAGVTEVPLSVLRSALERSKRVR
jgi:hypothetical protein